MHFEVYGQSCWLEAESRLLNNELVIVYKTLHKN